MLAVVAESEASGIPGIRLAMFGQCFGFPAFKAQSSGKGKCDLGYRVPSLSSGLVPFFVQKEQKGKAGPGNGLFMFTLRNCRFGTTAKTSLPRAP